MMTVILLAGLALGVLAAIGIAYGGASEHITVTKIQAERQQKLNEREALLRALLGESRQRTVAK
jgi:hypothetical protein